MPRLGTHKIVSDTVESIKRHLEISVKKMELLLTQVEKRKIDADAMNLLRDMELELVRHRNKIQEH